QIGAHRGLEPLRHAPDGDAGEQQRDGAQGLEERIRSHAAESCAEKCAMTSVRFARTNAQAGFQYGSGAGKNSNGTSVMNVFIQSAQYFMPAPTAAFSPSSTRPFLPPAEIMSWAYSTTSHSWA